MTRLLFTFVATTVLTASPVGMAHARLHVDVVKQGDLEIAVTTTFKSPADAVYRAFTSCEAIKEWMKPERMTLSACSIDARIGGSLVLKFLAGKDRKLEVRDSYRALDAPRLIQYEESYDFSPITISVTARLDESNGETRFNETLRYRSTAERDQDFPGIAGSAPGAYGKLDQYLQSK